MDEFLKQLETTTIIADRGFSLGDFLVGIIASAVLSMVISVVYRQTHTGLSYSRSFVLSIVIMSVTVCFIMLIIGSNLARAFSLVGALSIVRYRNAIKDTQDISYIFLAIAVGMACGTKLYGIAIIFTIFSSALMLFLDKISFGDEGKIDRLIRFSFPKKLDTYHETIHEELKKFSRRTILLSTENIGENTVIVFEADFPKNSGFDQILNHFNKNYKNLDVRVMTGFDQFNI